MRLSELLTYESQNLHRPSLEKKRTFRVAEKDLLRSKYLLQKVLVIQNNNRRQGTSSCKTRGSVQGGGKKPWKQKGTGRARAGSNSSPLWKGGGVIFGPSFKKYEKKINSKEKQLALKIAFYKNAYKLVVVENFFRNMPTLTKTKSMLCYIQQFISFKNTKNLLLVSEDNNKILSLALRNVSTLQILSTETLNLRDFLLARRVLITEEALVKIIRHNI